MRVKCLRLANQTVTIGGVSFAFGKDGVARPGLQPGLTVAVKLLLKKYVNQGAEELPPEAPPVPAFPIETPVVPDTRAGGSTLQLPDEIAHPAFATVPEDEIAPLDDDAAAKTGSALFAAATASLTAEPRAPEGEADEEEETTAESDPTTETAQPAKPRNKKRGGTQL